MRLIFEEVLNDLYSYFLLGDIVTLKNFQLQHQLPNDLATEFTTNATGDEVVTQGIMIALSDVENLPYTIIFTTESENLRLLQSNSHLQIQQDGYILKVESGEVRLFTWRWLQDFSEKTIQSYSQIADKLNRPKIALENGWYEVTILGGLIDTDTPTFEFVFTKLNTQKPFSATLYKSFKLVSDIN